MKEVFLEWILKPSLQKAKPTGCIYGVLANRHAMLDTVSNRTEWLQLFHISIQAYNRG